MIMYVQRDLYVSIVKKRVSKKIFFQGISHTYTTRCFSGIEKGSLNCFYRINL